MSDGVSGGPSSQNPPLDPTMVLEELLASSCDELDRAAEGGLLMAALYGSLVRGGWREGISDVNLLLVFDDLHLPRMEALAEPLQKARAEFSLAPVVFTAEELRRSADVFPARILEMSSAYRVLRGKDLLRTVNIRREHLRLQCEQEGRNALHRLRRAYLMRRPDSRALARALESFLSQFAGLLRVYLRLKGEAVPSSTLRLADAAASSIGFDPDVIRRVVETKGRSAQKSHAEIQELYGLVFGLLEGTVAAIDSLEF